MAFLTKICCKFTVASARKRILRSVNIWQSYRQESWLSHVLCAPQHCPAERLRTRQISWVLVMARNSCR